MTTAHTAHQKVIIHARGEVGYHEGYSGGHWNNAEKYAAQVPGLEWANYQAWCDTFVAWCFVQSQCVNLLAGGPTASVAVSRDSWKKAGRFHSYPAVGAQIIFGANGDSHTGIVVAYGPTTVTTVEGNTNDTGSPEGDGVYLKTHNRTDAWVYGYGYPDYPEGIDSADPNYTGTRVAPVPTAPARATAPAPTTTSATTTPAAHVKRDHDVQALRDARDHADLKSTKLGLTALIRRLLGKAPQ